MKNRVLVIILLIIILGSVATFVFLKLDSVVVSEFSFVCIIDSYGNKIENYQENKMPFIIVKTNEEQIKVNGKKVENGQRFYEPGEYKIEVTSNNKKEKSVVKIKQIEKDEQHIYNVYVTTETIQTLFAGLNISKDAQQKGYLWTARSATLNLEKIKEKMPNLELSKYNGTTDLNEFYSNVVSEIKEYVKKVLQEDKDAYFNLYIEEDKFYLELELFGKIGLDDSRYKVTMFINGTLGYVREYEITKSNSYERFKEEKQAYEEIVKGIKNNTKSYNNHPGSYLTDHKSIFGSNYNFDYMLISTLRKNISYKIQYPDMLKFEDDKIANEMKNANIEKIVAVDEFNGLKEQSKELFLYYVNVNKEELDEKYFNDENAKYLVITGTKPFYGNKEETKEDFERMVNTVCNEYKKEYILLYKPHPRALPNEEQEAYLNKLGIKVLPGSIPMEAIMFVYPNLKIGGFESSLYMSADKEQVEFFFTKSVDQLVEPLNQLYELLFNNAKLYN